MVKVVFDISGDKQVEREIFQFGERAEDMRPAWMAILSDLLFWEAEQFESEGMTGSKGWKPLSPSYAQWKESAYPGTKILHLTGALENALTGPGKPQGGIRLMTRRMLDFGTDLPYAAFHQRGTQGHQGRSVVATRESVGAHAGVPQRRPIELTMEQRKDVIQLATNWIKRGVI